MQIVVHSLSFYVRRFMNVDLLRLIWFVLLIAASGGPTSPLLAQSGHAERYVLAENVSSEAVDLDGEGVQLSVNAGSMRLELVTPSILHVQVAPQSSFSTRRSLAVLDTTSVVPATARRDGDHLVLSSDSLTARVHTESGRLTVEDVAGRPITTARAPAADHFERTETEVDTAWSVEQSFALTPDEGLFGLGQFQEGWLNYRGRSVLLVPSNTRAPIPLLVSSRGYGILWDNYSRSRFSSEQNEATFEAAVADQIDYYVVAGRTPDEAIAGYRALTGTVPMYPKWAYGYWQSRERYVDQEQVLDVAAEFRERNVPIDNLVQDWSYWPEDGYFSGLVWDSTRYPDPTAMIDTLHQDYNMQLMVSFWPAFGPKSDIYEAMKKNDLLFSEPHWADGARVYDAYSPEARDLYWKYVKRGLYDKGVDAWWMDGTEPEFRSTDDRYITEASMTANGPTALGSFDRYLTTFSQRTTKGMYEHLQEVSNDRPYILTRSASPGQQRYGATLWSGDIWAGWTVFRDQIAAGLNTSMAGYPYWTADIGAFKVDHRFPKGNDDPAYRELYTRWHQFGALSPLFRAHGTETEREIWYYGEPGTWAYDAIARANRLRYRLMPYIYTEAWQVYNEHASLMRALPLAFPNDPATYDANRTFLFGSNLLVSPVTKAMRHVPSKLRQFITTENMYDGDGRHYLTQKVYGGTAFDSLLATRRVENLRMTWQGSLPDPARDKPYSLRYTGRLKAEANGSYEFIATVDGGVQLRVNGETVIDAWDAPSAENDGPTEHSGTIALAAGEKADVTLEYKQPTPNAAHLILEWRPPGLRDKIVADTKQWSTYLPEGTDWYNFWTGERVAGGQTDSMRAPISRIPVYVPAGTILPLGPDRQYVGTTSADSLELRVYPGADATYTLYDDAGQGQGYTSGDHVQIPLSWDESAGTLTIGARNGSYPGMLEKRTFRVVMVGPERGTGLSPPRKPDAAVTYRGEEVTVQLDE